MAEQSFDDSGVEVEAMRSDIEHRAETHWTCREAKIHREATTLCLILEVIYVVSLPVLCFLSGKN
jgi:hypothetical protein